MRYQSSLEIWTYSSAVTTTSVSGLDGMDGNVELGVKYHLRSRIEQVLANGVEQSLVKTKMWEGPEEPSAWQLETQFNNNDLTAGRGSVFLLAYNSDVEWGPVEITAI